MTFERKKIWIFHPMIQPNIIKCGWSSHNGSWWYRDNEISFNLSTCDTSKKIHEQQTEIKAPDVAVSVNRAETKN